MTNDLVQICCVKENVAGKMYKVGVFSGRQKYSWF
jgi:hypothetical protein